MKGIKVMAPHSNAVPGIMLLLNHKYTAITLQKKAKCIPLATSANNISPAR
jgi:hypothetical protein